MKHTRYMTASALAIAAATAFAGSAQANTIDITSVVGLWQNINPGTTQGLTGQGTNEIRWGSPAPSSGDKSGYKFVGVAPPPQVNIAEDSVFNLGDFTHFNNPIFAEPEPSSIDSAELNLTIAFDFEGTSNIVNSVFTFLHDETPNDANPCADGGTDGVGVNEFGCADSVTPVNNFAKSDTFTINDRDLVFEVTGFSFGGPVFWTKEGVANTATLQGKFTVAPIPLPAAGWLLLAGIGGLGALRRFRKT